MIPKLDFTSTPGDGKVSRQTHQKMSVSGCTWKRIVGLWNQFGQDCLNWVFFSLLTPDLSSWVAFIILSGVHKNFSTRLSVNISNLENIFLFYVYLGFFVVKQSNCANFATSRFMIMYQWMYVIRIRFFNSLAKFQCQRSTSTFYDIFGKPKSYHTVKAVKTWLK